MSFEKMGFKVSDEMLAAFFPIVLYWVCSGIYVLLGLFEKYRLHLKIDEEEKNLVSRRTVVKGVLLYQTFEVVVTCLLLKVCT